MKQDHKYIIHIKELSVVIVDISLAIETKTCVSQGVGKDSTNVAIKVPFQEFKHLGGGGNDSDVDMALLLYDVLPTHSSDAELHFSSRRYHCCRISLLFLLSCSSKMVTLLVSVFTASCVKGYRSICSTPSMKMMTNNLHPF
jgi:hypothetical protein